MLNRVPRTPSCASLATKHHVKSLTPPECNVQQAIGPANKLQSLGSTKEGERLVMKNREKEQDTLSVTYPGHLDRHRPSERAGKNSEKCNLLYAARDFLACVT